MFDLRRKTRGRRNGGSTGEAPAQPAPAPAQPAPAPAPAQPAPAPAPAQPAPAQQVPLLANDAMVSGADVNRLLTAMQSGHQAQLQQLSSKFELKLQKNDAAKAEATKRAELIGQVKADPHLLAAMSASDPQWEQTVSLDSIALISKIYSQVKPATPGRTDVVTPGQGSAALTSNGQTDSVDPEAFKEAWAKARKQMLPGGVHVR